MRDKSVLVRTTFTLEQFIRRYWTLFCAAPVLLLFAYQLVKSGLSWKFASNLARPEVIHWDAILFLGIAFAGALLIVWWHDRWGPWLPLLAAAISVFACVGVRLQQDRILQWEGGDVSTNNYRAALLALDTGPGDLIATWNARANPYVEPNEIPHPREVIEKIERMGIGWLVGTRWARRDLPQDNNRMYMHPPGYPLALAGWLSLFGRSREAAQAFELFIKFFLVVGASIWAWRYIPASDSLNRVSASLLLATAPSLLLFIAPHANELAALLALVAFALGSHSYSAWRFPVYIATGILITAAAYTNFFHMLILAAVAGVLAFSKPAWGFTPRLTLASALGIGLVIFVFTILGYYPWLTYLTGSQLAHYYRLSHSVDLLTAMLGFSYLGLPLLLLTGLGLLELGQLRGVLMLPWMIAAVIALVAGSYQAFALGATGRYLIGMFFLLVPLLTLTLRKLDLTKVQVLMIPLANFAFVFLVLFL